jgi:hypothetical protein
LYLATAIGKAGDRNDGNAARHDPKIARDFEQAFVGAASVAVIKKESKGAFWDESSSSRRRLNVVAHRSCFRAKSATAAARAAEVAVSN